MAVERLGQDAGLPDDRHEVGVAIPARHDVGVEVGDAAAGGGAEVEAEVEAVGLDRGAEEAFAEGDLSIRSARSAGLSSCNVADLAVRDGEQVAGVVGKAVEHEVRVRAPVDDERRAVVPQGGQIGEGTLRFRIARRLDVFHAPVSVQLLHRSRRGRKNGEAGKVKAASRANLTQRGRVRDAEIDLPLGMTTVI